MFGDTVFASTEFNKKLESSTRTNKLYTEVVEEMDKTGLKN